MTSVSVAPNYVSLRDKVTEDKKAAMMGIKYCPKHIGTWISKPRKYLGNPTVRDCPDCTRNNMRYAAKNSILEMTTEMMNDDSSPLVGTKDIANLSNKTAHFVPPVLPDPKRRSEELLKKGDKLRTNWEKRHFVLEKGTLAYYKGSNHVNNPRGCGVQDLESYYYQDLPEDHGIEDFKKRIFLKSVDPSKPTFYLEAKNETHRNNWLVALDENIDYAEKMHEFKVLSETLSMDKLLERTSSLVVKNGVRRVSKSSSLRRASIVNNLGFVLHEEEKVLYDGILDNISYRQVKGTPDEVQRHVYLTSLPRLIYVNPQDRSDHHSIDLNDLPVIYLHGVDDEHENWFTIQIQEESDAKIMHFCPRDMTLAKLWVEKCLECGLCVEHTSGIVEIRKPVLWKTAFKNLVTGVDPPQTKISKSNSVLPNNLDWFVPLDTSSNSYACCLVNLSVTSASEEHPVCAISDPHTVLQKVSQLFYNNQHNFGRHTINHQILYNPAHNMKATVYIKFDEYAGNLLEIKTYIENNIDFTCDSVDVVLDGARRISACCNPEMELSLDTEMWQKLDWSGVTDKHCLKNYTQSIVVEHGDFVMFGPTYNYETKSWSTVVCLWILYYDAISRHFMYTPNEQRLVTHMGIRVQHFYGNFKKHQFNATDITMRGLWEQTNSQQDFYVGSAFCAAHPTIFPDHMRKATIGPSVRSVCRGLPAIIPDNWFVTAAHTFALPDILNDGDVVIPPIPYNSPIYDTFNPRINEPIGTYLGHDKSQCTAIVQITCPKLLNLIRVTQNDLLDIVGPEDDNSPPIDIDNMESSLWKDAIYKTGGRTATTRGEAYSYGCKISPNYKTPENGGILNCPDNYLQYLLVKRFPVRQTDNKFSKRGDSGAGVYTLVPSNSGVHEYSAKVFGLLEGGVPPFFSAIQPIHVPSLRNLALRTAHYQAALFNAIHLFINIPCCVHTIFECIASFVSNSSDDGRAARNTWQVVIKRHLFALQEKILAYARTAIAQKDYH